MMEVDESVPIIRTESDDRPAFQARDCFEELLRHLSRSPEQVLSYVVAVQNEFAPEFRHTYAFLSALAALGARRVRSPDVSEEFLTVIASYIFDQNLAVPLRAAGCDALSGFSFLITGEALTAFPATLLAHLTQDTDLDLFSAILSLLAKILKNPRCPIPSELPDSIICWLHASPPDTILYELFTLVSSLASKIDLSRFGPVLCEYATQDYPIDTRVKAIHAFSSSLRGRPAESQLLELIAFFTSHAISLIEHCDELINDVCVLIRCLGDSAAEFACALLPVLFPIASRTPPLFAYCDFCDNPSLVPVERPGPRTYVQASDVSSICDAFSLLCVCVPLVPESIPAAIDLCCSTIRSELRIEAIDGGAWSLLHSMPLSPDLILDLLPFVKYRRPLTISAVISVLVAFEFNGILPLVFECVQASASRILEQVEEMERFGDIDETRVGLCKDCKKLSRFGALVEKNAVAEQTYFCETIGPIALEWLKRPLLRIVGIQIMVGYFAGTGDLESLHSVMPTFTDVINTPVGSCESLGDEIKESVFKILGSVFERCELRREEAEYFEHLIAGYLDNMENAEEEDFAIEEWVRDQALVAFTKLIRANGRHFDMGETMDNWFAFLPLSTDTGEWPIVALLLAEWLENADVMSWTTDDLSAITELAGAKQMFRYCGKSARERIVLSVRRLGQIRPELIAETLEDLKQDPRDYRFFQRILYQPIAARP
jgi:hypothetical protein